MPAFISMSVMLSAPGASVQDSILTSDMDAAFVATSGVRRIRDLYKSITSLYLGRLTTVPMQLEFVYPLFQQRSDCWSRTVCRSSDMNVSFKQQVYRLL